MFPGWCTSRYFDEPAYSNVENAKTYYIKLLNFYLYCTLTGARQSQLGSSTIGWSYSVWGIDQTVGILFQGHKIRTPGDDFSRCSFSASRSFNHLASVAFIPSHVFFHRYDVLLVTPNKQATSKKAAPLLSISSPSATPLITCSSVLCLDSTLSRFSISILEALTHISARPVLEVPVNFNELDRSIYWQLVNHET